VFVQSHVDEHARLSHLLECVATDGEMRRMIQYREKAAREQRRGGRVRLSLLTYPVLMAADILAYGTDEVAVGDDQTQHEGRTRAVGVPCSRRYGQAVVVPRATHPKVAARVMNDQDARSKMGKSDDAGPGIVYVRDEPDVVRRKVMRAMTDSGRDVVYDRESRPGVANLLEILAACTGGNPEALGGVCGSDG